MKNRLSKILSAVLAAAILVSSAVALTSCSALDSGSVKAAFLKAFTASEAEASVSMTAQNVFSFTDGDKTVSFKESFSYTLKTPAADASSASGAASEPRMTLIADYAADRDGSGYKTYEKNGYFFDGGIIYKDFSKVVSVVGEDNTPAEQTLTSKTRQTIAFADAKSLLYSADTVAFSAESFEMKDISKSSVGSETSYVFTADGEIFTADEIQALYDSVCEDGGKIKSFTVTDSRGMYVITDDGKDSAHLIYDFTKYVIEAEVTVGEAARTVGMTVENAVKLLGYGDGVVITPFTELDKYTEQPAE